MNVFFALKGSKIFILMGQDFVYTKQKRNKNIQMSSVLDLDQFLFFYTGCSMSIFVYS